MTMMPKMQTASELLLGPWALNTVHNVDALMGLRDIPSDSFDVVVTSPPYWGQRGSAGLGSEPDPRDYVKNKVLSPRILIDGADSVAALNGPEVFSADPITVVAYILLPSIGSSKQLSFKRVLLPRNIQELF